MSQSVSYRHVAKASLEALATQAGVDVALHQPLFTAIAALQSNMQQEVDRLLPNLDNNLLDYFLPGLNCDIPAMKLMQVNYLKTKLLDTNTILPGKTMLQASDGSKWHTAWPVNLLPATVIATEYCNLPDNCSQLTVKIKINQQLNAKHFAMPWQFAITTIEPLNFDLLKLLICNIDNIQLAKHNCSQEQLIKIGGQENIKWSSQCWDSVLTNITIDDFLPLHKLRDLLHFPVKYCFVDLIWPNSHIDLDHNSEHIIIKIKFNNQLAVDNLLPDSKLSESCLQLQIVPVINSFIQNAEPFVLDGKRLRYPVLLDTNSKYKSHFIKVANMHAVTQQDYATVSALEYTNVNMSNSQPSYSLYKLINRKSAADNYLQFINQEQLLNNVISYAVHACDGVAVNQQLNQLITMQPIDSYWKVILNLTDTKAQYNAVFCYAKSHESLMPVWLQLLRGDISKLSSKHQLSEFIAAISTANSKLANQFMASLQNVTTMQTVAIVGGVPWHAQVLEIQLLNAEADMHGVWFCVSYALHKLLENLMAPEQQLQTKWQLNTDHNSYKWSFTHADQLVAVNSPA